VPVRYEIDGDAGLVRVELSATVTTAELLASYAALGREPAARGLAVLADGRAVTSVPAFAQLKSLASMRLRVPAHLGPLRVAVVVGSVCLFGIARQFGAMVERVGLIVVPFYDPVEAEQSLLVPAGVGSQQTPW
jgi:hypothetical protein